MNRTEEIAHAREVDTEVARLYGEYYDARDRLNTLRTRIRDARKTLARRPDRYLSERLERDLASVEALELVAADRARKADEFNTANYEGWARFFHVQHIHGNLHCSSFRPTTRVGWLPDVSGLTEAEAVAEHGATLCTICFPSAPTELTTKAADPDACPGSGKYIPYDQTIRSRGKYAECPECHEIIYRTPGSGNLRKHKTKGA